METAHTPCKRSKHDDDRRSASPSSSSTPSRTGWRQPQAPLRAVSPSFFASQGTPVPEFRWSRSPGSAVSTVLFPLHPFRQSRERLESVRPRESRAVLTRCVRGSISPNLTHVRWRLTFGLRAVSGRFHPNLPPQLGARSLPTWRPSLRAERATSRVTVEVKVPTFNHPLLKTQQQVCLLPIAQD